MGDSMKTAISPNSLNTIQNLPDKIEAHEWYTIPVSITKGMGNVWQMQPVNWPAPDFYQRYLVIGVTPDTNIANQQVSTWVKGTYTTPCPILSAIGYPLDANMIPSGTTIVLLIDNVSNTARLISPSFSEIPLQWHDLTLYNTATYYQQKPQYAKDMQGRVHLRGSFYKEGSRPFPPANAFATLPEGFRPKRDCAFSASALIGNYTNMTGDPCVIFIQANNGTMKLLKQSYNTSFAGGTISLMNFSFDTQ